MRIRRATREDAPDWLRMREALWPRDASAHLQKELEDILDDPDRCETYVAETPEGTFCGCVEVSLGDGAVGCTTLPVGYLEAWYVDPWWRRQGIGRQLVAAAEEWARAKGCQEMASDTTPDYPGSPEAHQALGYDEADALMHFRKSLVR